ncbi:hypothetical protein [Actinomadura rudentiformis]|uniref:Secreted protein n=1 Tax=Actinomadura rudentiformis TaxID=359158 RepID=A0A6H9YRA4_9ACTN|nr:hypothetical protein [Actinomadura rudentiformis]KAB2345576.1 hypothetical protein F8566_26900 [Actinomadura rudentiformis]
MARIRQTVTVGITALAVVAVAAPPASAVTTTIRKGSATADAYSGNVRASLLGEATVTTSIGSGSCNQSTMTGSINSNGSNLSISGVTFNTNGGPCTGSVSSTITPENLPWSGGNVTWDAAHTGGRDATVLISNFRIKAVVDLLGGITCYFGGNLTANGFNGDNPSRPVATNNQAQVGVTNATVNRLSGGNFFCPSTATVNATYQLLGETTPGSGTYDQSLYVTGTNP